MAIDLTLWIERVDSNDAVELYVRFKSIAFSGQSSAWVKPSQLVQFSDAMSVYPLSAANIPMLIGGYWNRAGTALVDEHIHISLEPAGRLGALNMLVKVAVPQEGPPSTKVKYAASANFLAEYEKIREFANCLRSLAEGRESSASLTLAE